MYESSDDSSNYTYTDGIESTGEICLRDCGPQNVPFSVNAYMKYVVWARSVGE